MTATIGIRELARNSHLLDEYDYVDIEDKKTHKYKGLFVSAKYAKEFKEILDKRIAQEKQEKLDRIKPFLGTIEIDDNFSSLSSKQIKQKISLEKYED